MRTALLLSLTVALGCTVDRTRPMGDDDGDAGDGGGGAGRGGSAGRGGAGAGGAGSGGDPGAGGAGAPGGGGVAGQGGGGGGAPRGLRVGYAIDGDTVVLYDDTGMTDGSGMPLDGRHVRMLGIDTPEIGHNGAADEPFAQMSKQFVHGFAGRRVRLEYNTLPGMPQQDDFGRLLAFVITDGGLNIAEEVLRAGLGCEFEPRSSRYAHQYRPAFATVEADAKTARLGIWAMRLDIRCWNEGW